MSTNSGRGFAAMRDNDPKKQREIASKGGKTAHANGTAHEWTREEARKAGAKGGQTARANDRERIKEREQKVARAL